MLLARPILDTNVLQHFAFAHPDGINILLKGIKNQSAYFPREIYNQDENELPLENHDVELSELARGLRYAKRRAMNPSDEKASRYQTWLNNSKQLPRHLERGSLIIAELVANEIPKREAVISQFGIAKGEAACLVLAQRFERVAVFTSMDNRALRAAEQLSIGVVSGLDVLMSYVKDQRPSEDFLRDFLEGLSNAGYRLRDTEIEQLFNLI